MNKIELTGRLVRDAELKALPSGSVNTEFTIAVPRKSKERETDFITQYIHKGEKFGLVGRLQTREYTTQDGQKRTVSEVVVDEIDFLQDKSAPEEEQRPVLTSVQIQQRMSQMDDDELPF